MLPYVCMQVATMVEALPVAAVNEELPQLLRIRELTAQAAEAAQVGMAGPVVKIANGRNSCRWLERS
jgi:hypothetical protein